MPHPGLTLTRVTAGQPPGHGGGLGCLRRLGGGCLLLHLLETLPQVKHLGVGQRIDLVHRVPRGATSLPETYEVRLGDISDARPYLSR